MVKDILLAGELPEIREGIALWSSYRGAYRGVLPVGLRTALHLRRVVGRPPSQQ